jgi:hypothetical protein
MALSAVTGKNAYKNIVVIGGGIQGTFFFSVSLSLCLAPPAIPFLGLARVLLSFSFGPWFLVLVGIIITLGFRMIL